MNLKEIALPPEKEFYYLRDNGKLLIFPRMNPEWTKDNLIFRSSMWDESTGELISASYPKFFNWGEKETLAPLPTDLTKCSLVEKIDGSTLAISYHKGELIIRTRGTHSYITQKNASEIPELLKRYPNIEREVKSTPDWTHLFEWVTPSNQIVIPYSEPDLYLTGAIWHGDYELNSQKNLDNIAVVMGVKRPARYSFNSISEMKEAVQAFDGKEGICVYYNNDQSILKLKSLSYLKRHRFKFLCTEEEVIDLFLLYNKPRYHEFYLLIEKVFDYECAEMAKNLLSRVCDTWKEVEKIIEGFDSFVERVKGLDRKEQAAKILSAYGKTSRSGFVFTRLDGKELGTQAEKKLMLQLQKT
jgi:hypothetical protein